MEVKDSRLLFASFFLIYRPWLLSHKTPFSCKQSWKVGHCFSLELSNRFSATLFMKNALKNVSYVHSLQNFLHHIDDNAHSLFCPPKLLSWKRRLTLLSCNFAFATPASLAVLVTFWIKKHWVGWDSQRASSQPYHALLNISESDKTFREIGLIACKSCDYSQVSISLSLTFPLRTAQNIKLLLILPFSPHLLRAFTRLSTGSLLQ